MPLSAGISILQTNGLERKHYSEPFAGGCGLALMLLYEGNVSDIHLNDVDPAIWSFWHCVLNYTDDLVHMIAETPVTIDEWLCQREIHRAADSKDPLALGFSTFFLNRTNRSGIIKEAGVIGGLSQDGAYKIDCRFNRDDLIRRIRRIEKYKNRIHLYNLDALFFISEISVHLPSTAFFSIDPPYFNKGSDLYTSFYNPSDHSELALAVLGIKNPWIVTYDNAPEIMRLYRERRQFEFDINYSVKTKRPGNRTASFLKRIKDSGGKSGNDKSISPGTAPRDISWPQTSDCSYWFSHAYPPTVGVVPSAPPSDWSARWSRHRRSRCRRGSGHRAARHRRGWCRRASPAARTWSGG